MRVNSPVLPGEHLHGDERGPRRNPQRHRVDVRVAHVDSSEFERPAGPIVVEHTDLDTHPQIVLSGQQGGCCFVAHLSRADHPADRPELPPKRARQPGL
ncbi:hypothetical protein ACFQ1S_34340, partial [Kibdelosporangium lantanae]